ncbi:MAG: hypothetical protein ACYS5V_09350, partial [Planctomycetota bacterium]|jgi:hypothetical protein
MGQLMFDLKTGQKSRTWYKERSFGAKRWKHDYLLSGSGRDTSAVFPFGFLHDRKYGSRLERYHATHWYYRGARGLILAFTDDTVFGVVVTRRMRGNVQLFARRPDASPAAERGGALWAVELPRGSVQAILPDKATLFVAGPAKEGGMVTSYSVKDGRRLGTLQFDDSPVFDGLAATGERLYVCTRMGKVFCFGKK